jgi:hypothetical protein
MDPQHFPIPDPSLKLRVQMSRKQPWSLANVIQYLFHAHRFSFQAHIGQQGNGGSVARTECDIL